MRSKYVKISIACDIVLVIGCLIRLIFSLFLEGMPQRVGIIVSLFLLCVAILNLVCVIKDKK